MREAIYNNNGTGKKSDPNIDGVNVYGKTGTAQNPHGEDHSWFAGYMKIQNNPILSLSILVEHGGKGSIESTKIAGKLFEYYRKNELVQ